MPSKSRPPRRKPAPRSAKPKSARRVTSRKGPAPSAKAVRTEQRRGAPSNPTELPVALEPVEVRPRTPGTGSNIFPINLDTTNIEQALAKVSGELKHWANKGRYTKVRFKFRGKQLLPDLPLAAVAAAEGLTFYWGGILRALVFNVAGGSVLQVELVNDADKKVQQGREQLLSGDVDAALALFREAIAMDRDNPRAHLNVGVAMKLKGDTAAARASLENARALDPEGPTGAEAEKVLKTLPVPLT